MSLQPVSATVQSTECPSLRRLLLCEVILEEYESLDQPPLDQNELLSIKNEIIEHHRLAETFPESERTIRETDFNSGIVKRLYRLMSKAQLNQAESDAEKNFAQYREAVTKLDNQLSDDQLNRVAARAVVAEIYGHVEELRTKFKSEFIQIKDETERHTKVEEAILRKLSVEAVGDQKKEAQGLKGTGDGRTKVDEGITRKQAERVAAGTMRSALCLSGGGIRSATFNLGILQGLARHGLLEKFDYLSTVSGGGFIGGWLSAWICRRGLQPVMEELKSPPPSPLKVDPDPVEHLRIYSNYLSPQPGLLSADTWTLIASLLRNLLLNWIVFIPVLILALLVPRLWTAIVLRSTHHVHYSLPISLLVGVLSGMWALIYIGLKLPGSSPYDTNPERERYKGGQGQFIRWCLIWLVLSAASLSVFVWTRFRPSREPFGWYYFLLVAVLMVAPGWVIYVIKTIKFKPRGQRSLKMVVGLVLATSLIFLSLTISGYLASYANNSLLPGIAPDKLVYSIFSVPQALLLMLLAGILMTGLTSRFAYDDDQEWWARVGAWVFIVIIAWSLGHILVLYGPLMLLTLGTTVKRIQEVGITKLPWSDVGKIAGTAVGVISGIVTLVGGFSAKTPANAKEGKSAGTAGLLLAFATSLLAPIFLAFIVVLISLGTNWILISRVGQIMSYFSSGGELPTPASSPSLYDWHLLLLEQTSFRLLIVFAVLLIIFIICIGPLISTNAFSLQYLWRNRIIRAYLGASHKHRRPNPFTGFDTYDNLQMYELRQQPAGVEQPPVRLGRPADDITKPPATRKLLHILNLALNLSGGEKLQWQDRRAESFTVSPLHAGSYWLGYRRAFKYGGQEGISLGAAVAISGAFVSPNMGFMMTSPIVRFLMALFNVRFGWWLGNPGSAGDKPNFIEKVLNIPIRLFGNPVDRPFLLDSPSLSVLPFIAEAFGNTDDKSPYVYLSDGGHFENLGLYEMVLRRCRFIVVSDASTDPDYSFQSLALAIRQIRVDLGVPIEIPELSVTLPSQDMKSKYCAIGTVRYSCVDRDPNDLTSNDKDFDGVIIFIKPSLIGAEPRDVVNYWQAKNSFPQEVITDQWFSEAQFESYRALGSYIIDAICDGSRNETNLAAFAAKVRDHNQLDFRAFREQVSYMALQEEFKTHMQQASITSFREKVRRFMETLLRG
jgi:uncharacterized protein YjiS (DUF1127 family)